MRGRTPLAQALAKIRLPACWLASLLSRRDVLFGIAMATAVWAAMPTLWEALTPPDFSRGWQRDCDIVLMRQSLLEHPRLRDTVDWWTGTWVGVVSFWRPISSLLFWAEWRLFGWENQDAFMLVHALSWVVLCALLFLLAERALSSPVAGAATVVVFSVSGPGVETYHLWTTTGKVALCHWKNSVDLWLATALVGAALAAWNGRWLAAVALAAVACGIKETGFAGLALLVLVAAVRRKWPAAAVGAGTLAVLACWRLRAVGYGFVLGTNRALGARMALTLLPYPVASLLLAPIRPFALLGFALAAAVLLPRRVRWPAAAALVAAAVAVVWASGRGTDFAVSLLEAPTLFVGWRTITVALPVAAWIVAAVWGISWPTALAAAAWWVLALPTTLAPQVRAHAMVPANAFGAIAIVSAWWHTVRRLQRLRNG